MSLDGIRALLQAGRQKAAVRAALASGQGEVALAHLPPDGLHGCVLAERLRFGPPETWLGWSRIWGRVALKLWIDAKAPAPGRRVSFRHPGVAPLLDWGETWRTYAWIEGETLAAALHRGEILTEAMVDEIGAAIGSLHRAGLCHGDLTPANVILRSGGRGVVLIDWAEGTP